MGDMLVDERKFFDEKGRAVEAVVRANATCG